VKWRIQLCVCHRKPYHTHHVFLYYVVLSIQFQVFFVFWPECCQGSKSVKSKVSCWWI